MKQYSVQTRDIIFLKGFGFLSFANLMEKSLAKKISKIVSAKYSQKRLVMLNNLPKMYLKLL